MTADEERLRAMLHDAAPDLGGLDAETVTSRHRSGRRVAAVAAVVVAVSVLAIVLALSRGTSSRAPAADGTSPVAPPPNTSAPLDLAALTADIPCPDKLQRVSPNDLTSVAAVAVFTCGIDERHYPDGDWTVSTRKAATPDIAALVAAIQAPVPPTPSGDYACADVLYGDPGVVFVDAEGHYLLPEFRRGVCDVPIGLYAVDKIKWQELSAHKEHLDQSSEEIAAGCSHQYKNMNYYEAQNPDPRLHGGGSVFPDDGNTLHACVYHTSDEIDVGTFVRNIVFDADQSDRLRSALSGPGPTGDCAAQHDFALVFDGKHQVDVELGGCHRVLSSYTDLAARVTGTEVGTADGAVLQDLFGQS